MRSVVLLLALLVAESTAGGFYYHHQKHNSLIVGYALAEPNSAEPWSCRVRLHKGDNKAPLGPMVFEKFVSCSVTEMTFHDLELGQTYAINISGVAKDVIRGEDSKLDASQSTAFDMHQVPVPLVNATPISDSQILVQWSYEFLNGESFPLKTELILGDKAQTINGTNKWTVLKDLEPATTYEVRVNLTYTDRGSFVQNSSEFVSATTFEKDLLKPDLTVSSKEAPWAGGESSITLEWRTFPDGYPECQFVTSVCQKADPIICYTSRRGAVVRKATLTEEFALGDYDAVVNATCVYEDLTSVVWPSDKKEFTLSKNGF